MTNLLLMLGFFIASFFIGYILISRIPSLLHTPLMSMTNAVSGVTILGAMLLFTISGTATENIFGSLAIVAATFNVVGGFAITDRMLGLFKGKSKKENF
ncbi:MAG: NAD(P) transhydrogenase subunit alpha [Desulfamplus sp.]|nr:NAD(P) transhydrogenase subunit alpha [Desulfamplus sp.]